VPPQKSEIFKTIAAKSSNAAKVIIYCLVYDMKERAGFNWLRIGSVRGWMNTALNLRASLKYEFLLMKISALAGRSSNLLFCL
jgi:hypothetical protein